MGIDFLILQKPALFPQQHNDPTFNPNPPTPTPQPPRTHLVVMQPHRIPGLPGRRHGRGGAVGQRQGRVGVDPLRGVGAQLQVVLVGCRGCGCVCVCWGGRERRVGGGGMRCVESCSGGL